jgi:hypothetical protein
MDDQRAAHFGADLRLGWTHRGADLVVDGAGDFAVAEGVANILQALPLRLRIRRGELAALGHHRHGSRIDELIGEPNTTRTHVLLMARAREAIERDPRVVEIRDLHAQVPPGERDVIRLTMQVELVSASSPVTLMHDVALEPA